MVAGTAPEDLDGLANGVENERVVVEDDLVNVGVERAGEIAPAALADLDGDGCLDAGDDEGRAVSSTWSTMSSSSGSSSVDPAGLKASSIESESIITTTDAYGYRAIRRPNPRTSSPIPSAVQLKLWQPVATVTFVEECGITMSSPASTKRRASGAVVGILRRHSPFSNITHADPLPIRISLWINRGDGLYYSYRITDAAS